MMIAHNNHSSPTYSTTSPYNYQQQHQQQQQQLQSSQQQQYQQQPQHLDIDAAEPLESESLASSPQSTQSSLLSQYSFQHSPLSTTFAPRRPLGNIHPDFKFPASTPVFDAGSLHGDQQNIVSLSQVPDLMPSAEQWLLHGQQQTPRAALRLGHHRESSLSSLGSNGPASPYNANTSNPHIAVTDSSGDGFHDLGGGDNNYSYHAGKPLGLSDHFYATLPNFGSGASFGDSLHGMSTAAASQQPRSKIDRNLLPAPELSMGLSSRSHPVSVASSIAGGDSPATPSYQDAEDDVRRRKNGFNNVPKLDRTMTDIYSDELYSPNFTITSASPPPQTHMAMSTNNDLFAQRLQAANSQHLNAAHSPLSMSSRHQSPFRNGSPLAPSLNDFSQSGGQPRLASAQQLREKQKAEQNAKMVQQQLAHSAGQQHQQQGTPSTISPKDALLEFNEADEAANFPLFPVQEAHGFALGNPMGKMMASAPQHQQPQQQHQPTPQGFSVTPLQSAFNFNMPTGIQVPQQYPFVARPRHTPQPQQPQLQMTQPQQEPTPSISTFSRMSSAETSHSESSSVPVQRPARANADGGTYTCTYHGCTQRFETPALLQKHKREGHRQANALSNARAPVPSESSPESLFNTQAGPHRCDRINPSTGKPCNTIFSRPYDLTRHEDTIHNARKQKVRCNLCTEEKTFSRADALTRHYRVCHPDVEFPGKHRRRGGSAI